MPRIIGRAQPTMIHLRRKPRSDSNPGIVERLNGVGSRLLAACDQQARVLDFGVLRHRQGENCGRKKNSKSSPEHEFCRHGLILVAAARLRSQTKAKTRIRNTPGRHGCQWLRGHGRSSEVSDAQPFPNRGASELAKRLPPAAGRKTAVSKKEPPSRFLRQAPPRAPASVRL